MDVLSELLQALRIRGHVLLHEAYVPPWAVEIPESTELARMLGASDRARALAFHLVLRGELVLTGSGAPRDPLRAGELAVCFGGRAHRLQVGSSRSAVDLASLLRKRTGQAGSGADSGKGTLLLCGAFLVEDTHLNPLFAALPPVLRSTVLQWADATRPTGIVERLVREVRTRAPGSAYSIERLLELLCSEVVRSYADAEADQLTGWLGALRDPIVGRAISLLHAEPGRDWSVPRLARAVSMSPSRFAARFAGAVGEGPMTYATKWRVHVARRLLRDTDRGMDEIAADVGYSNLAAFSRAFKRHTGSPPATLRRAARAGGR